MPRKRVAHTVGEWAEITRLITPETTAEIPVLEHFQTQLQSFTEEFNRLAVERNYHAARKQEATSRMNELLEEGSRLTTLIRMALKEHFGPESEQLAGFGIQPFRGRRRSSRKTDPASPEPEENPST
jgi:hypothetical protein